MRFIRKNITTWNTAKSSRCVRHHTISFLLFYPLYTFPLQLPAVFALLFPRGGLNAADAGRKPGSKMQSEADRKQVMIMDELKRLREAAGLSQVQLALRLGVSQGTIAHWEIGRRAPQARHLIKLANILGCSVDALLGLNTQGADAARDNTIPDREVRVNG